MFCACIFLNSMIYAQEDSQVYKVVDEMPYFQGCEDFPTYRERAKCGERKMLDFIYKRMLYPPEARENNVQGMVVVQFVIARDGYLEDIELIRDIGSGCGEAAMSTIEDMNEMDAPPFTPGVNKGKVVPVEYTLPIRFKMATLK